MFRSKQKCESFYWKPISKVRLCITEGSLNETESDVELNTLKFAHPARESGRKSGINQIGGEISSQRSSRNNDGHLSNDCNREGNPCLVLVREISV